MKELGWRIGRLPAEAAGRNTLLPLAPQPQCTLKRTAQALSWFGCEQLLIPLLGGMAAKCCAVNIDNWRPDDGAWQSALQLVQPIERERIRNIHSRHVAKRTLVGRLLMRFVVQRELGIPNGRINLARTKQGKPFLKNLQCRKCSQGGSAPKTPEGSKNGVPYNFSINVSHHGSWVAVGFSTHEEHPEGDGRIVAVGIDVVKYEFRRGFADVGSFFESLTSSFTHEEWRQIREPIDPKKMSQGNGDFLAQPGSAFVHLQRLYNRWAVKEAYTKALGVGLDFGFDRIECVDKSADGKCPIVIVDGDSPIYPSRFFSLALDRLHRVVLCSLSKEHRPQSDSADATCHHGCHDSVTYDVKVERLDCQDVLVSLDHFEPRRFPTMPFGWSSLTVSSPNDAAHPPALAKSLISKKVTI